MSVFSEENAAITEYVGRHEGFFGIIKQRFSDFHVNEITAANKVVHLTCTESKIIGASISEETNKNEQENLKKPAEITEDNLTLLEVLSGKKTIHDVKTKVVPSEDGDGFVCTGVALGEIPADVKIDVTDADKVARKSIHEYIKTTFPILCSTTFSGGDRKFIRVFKKDGSRICALEEKRSQPKTFTTFVLYKENLDTTYAISLMASRLRLKPASFAYAGMKDKRGKTSQLVSLYQVPAANIYGACKHLRGVRVGDFKVLPTPQKLGQLRGNHFTIVLREVKGEDEVILEGINSLSNNGFLNYYGLQRFSGGSGNSGTHEIGKAILTQNFEKALNLIMSGHSNDGEDMTQCRQVWKDTKDASLAFGKLKKYHRFTIEGCLLSALSLKGTNVISALEKVPRNSRLLYIHAYQSYIWNSVLSRRVNKYGLKVLQGDLVKISTKDELKLGTSSERSENTENLQDNSNLDREEEGNETSEPVYVLREEDLGKVHISDIVLPLPGHKVVYPNNELGEWYEDMLKADGLSSKLLMHKMKVYSLTGAYRNMLIVPSRIDSEICFYDDPLKALVVSDWERIQNIKCNENRLKEGKLKAVVLEFSLPSSSYATMALREMLKMGTASQYHSSLNSSNAMTNPSATSGENGQIISAKSAESIVEKEKISENVLEISDMVDSKGKSQKLHSDNVVSDATERNKSTEVVILDGTTVETTSGIGESLEKDNITVEGGKLLDGASGLSDKTMTNSKNVVGTSTEPFGTSMDALVTGLKRNATSTESEESSKKRKSEN